MKSIEISARTVDEAVKLAAQELDVSLEKIEIEVLEEPAKGFLGILGSRQARIRARVKEDKQDKAKRFLEEVTAHMGIKTTVQIEESDDYVRMTLSGGNLGSIIGRRGETLDALQYLANLVANKEGGERKKIILDAEGYRKRREDTLRTLAKRLADKVKRSGQPVVLEPMNPQERRVIHTALQNDTRVQTLSEGEEPYRKVVISLKER